MRGCDVPAGTGCKGECVNIVLSLGSQVSSEDRKNATFNVEIHYSLRKINN
jgi:hypothetical protein